MTEKEKKILSKVNSELKNMKTTVDGKDHLEARMKFRSSIQVNRKKIIARKQKYKERY